MCNCSDAMQGTTDRKQGRRTNVCSGDCISLVVCETRHHRLPSASPSPSSTPSHHGTTIVHTLYTRLRLGAWKDRQHKRNNASEDCLSMQLVCYTFAWAYHNVVGLGAKRLLVALLISYVFSGFARFERKRNGAASKCTGSRAPAADTASTTVCVVYLQCQLGTFCDFMLNASQVLIRQCVIYKPEFCRGAGNHHSQRSNDKQSCTRCLSAHVRFQTVKQASFAKILSHTLPDAATLELIQQTASEV